ncbi:MAG: S8 family serine peptidase, partial [Acidobacteria bacterium]|nr:S8 family serine peptidase [Acidobacteriota bacterium]
MVAAVRRHVWLALFAGAVVGCVSLTQLSPGTRTAASRPHLDRVLQQQLDSDDAASIQVIARAAAGHEIAEVSADARAVGAHVVAELPMVDAVTMRIARRELRRLTTLPSIATLSVDGPVAMAASATNPWTSLLPGTNTYQTLGITDLTLMGDTIGVAIIDTGIVGGTAGSVVNFFDFTKSATTVASVIAYDDNGHGTHVAGLIGDPGVQSYGNVGGVAPNVRLIGMKVLDAQGQGTTTNVIRALDYAVKNRSVLGIDVINLSLGHPIYESADTDPLVQAVQRTVAAGIVVVVAAGNEGANRTTGEVGYAGILSPGNAPSAITVGTADTLATGTRTDDRVAPFSSRGPTWYDAYAKPDVIAPGRRQLSTAAPGSTLYNTYQTKLVVFLNPTATKTSKVTAPSRYISLSGTSMSTGVVAGVVARVLQAHRLTYTAATNTTWKPSKLPPNLVKAILMYTATLMSDENGNVYDVLTQGAGEVNAAGAVALARLVNTSMPANAPWLTAPLVPRTTFGADTLAWSQRLVWGDRLVWGNDVPIETNADVWSNRLVWGSRLVWGNAQDAASATASVAG